MLNAKQENLKSSRLDLQRELEAAGAKFKGKACTCIFHDDKHASAEVRESKTSGHFYFACYGCGTRHDIFSLRASLNKTTVADEMRKIGDAEWFKKAMPPKEVFGTIDAMVAKFSGVEYVYKYSHPDSGIVEMIVIRYMRDGRKAFAQGSPTPGGYWLESPIGSTPLYNRTRVRKADAVVVVEGEKCVHALADVGIVATTSPGGAMAGEKADWMPLAGKMAILWPDLDEPEDEYPEGKGVWHMQRVAKILQNLSPPCQVMWFNPEPLDLPVKGDAADAVARLLETYTTQQTKALIENALADAEAMGIMGEYSKEMEATIEGKRRAIPFPWQSLTRGARALMPAKVTCVCGDGGCGKSLLMLQCILYWNICKTRACIYELEDDRNYHLRRIHAQVAGQSGLTDNDWVEANPHWCRESTAIHREQMEEVGRAIWEAPEESVSLDMLATWIEARAKDGFEIICIDPITASSSEARPWVADLQFITKCKVIARRYGCRVILITHPRTGTKGPKATHNDMAGGAAYPRFAHTVLWLERNDTDAEYKVRDEHGFISLMRPNRVMAISKARNGPNAGRRIAFEFVPGTLCYIEHGIIEKD